MMSAEAVAAGGGVASMASGGTVATMQSIGAAGLGVGSTCLVACSGAALAGAAVYGAYRYCNGQPEPKEMQLTQAQYERISVINWSCKHCGRKRKDHFGDQMFCKPVTDSDQPVTDVGEPVTDSDQPVTDVGDPVTDSAP